jgi:hypothetical protein
MTPPEIESCAKRAYETFSFMVGESAPWDGLPTQHQWLDRVRAYSPDAAPANTQEECVKQAIEGMRSPPEEVEVAEVIEPEIAESETTEATPPPKKKGAK